MIASPGEAMFDFIALAVETLRHAYFPFGRGFFRSGIESMVDATTLGFEPIIDPLAFVIKATIDSSATLIQAAINPIPEMIMKTFLSESRCHAT